MFSLFKTNYFLYAMESLKTRKKVWKGFQCFLMRRQRESLGRNLNSLKQLLVAELLHAFLCTLCIPWLAKTAILFYLAQKLCRGNSTMVAVIREQLVLSHVFSKTLLQARKGLCVNETWRISSVWSQSYVRFNCLEWSAIAVIFTEGLPQPCCLLLSCRV